MKSKIVALMLIVVVVLGLVLACCAGGAAEETELVMHTAAVGSAGYATATGLEALSMDVHPWLRIKALESAGGGSTVAMIMTKPEWKNDVIQMADLWDLYASGDIPGYETEEAFPNVREDIMDLITFCGGNLYFVTSDPDIKTLKDLSGKRVGVARIGQGHWGGVPTLFFNGLYPEWDVSVDYCGGTNGAVAALLDGKVDACVMGAACSPDYTTVRQLDFMITLEASGRDYHCVGFTDEEAAKFMDNSNGVIATVMPAGTVLNQSEPITTLWACWSWGVLPTFPEDLAYEFVSFYLNNHEGLEAYTPLAGVLNSPEKLASALQAKYVHPGALKAFEEAGVTIP